jgi:hypothetical protein
VSKKRDPTSLCNIAQKNGLIRIHPQKSTAGKNSLKNKIDVLGKNKQNETDTQK